MKKSWKIWKVSDERALRTVVNTLKRCSRRRNEESKNRVVESKMGFR